MAKEIHEQIVLAVGQILHAGSGQAVIGRVRVEEQHARLAKRRSMLAAKYLANGTIVLSGQLGELFPELDKQAYRLQLNIHATSTQFRQGHATHPLTVQIPMGSSFDPPINLGVIRLPADPLQIRGRVVEARDPARPIATATILVTHSGPGLPRAQADANGNYRFQHVVVVAPATIECRAGGYKPQSRALLIDYSAALAEEHFRLVPL